MDAIDNIKIEVCNIKEIRFKQIKRQIILEVIAETNKLERGVEIDINFTT